MIRPVSYSEILSDPDAAHLLREYALECSLPELGYASPQPELYALLEKSGGFQAFEAREKNGLVGFSTVLSYILPHYGQKVSTTESIFVARQYPKAGMDLMVDIENFARLQESVAFLYSAPVGSRFDRLLSTSRRYRHTNNVYLRSLL